MTMVMMVMMVMMLAVLEKGSSGSMMQGEGNKHEELSTSMLMLISQSRLLLERGAAFMPSLTSFTTLYHLIPHDVLRSHMNLVFLWLLGYVCPQEQFGCQ